MHSLMYDRGTSLIQMDGILRENAGVRLDESVQVEKATPSMLPRSPCSVCNLRLPYLEAACENLFDGRDSAFLDHLSNSGFRNPML
jgi:hypothetical protein